MLRMRRSVLVLAALATLMGLAFPAQASFPGRNGRIAFVETDPAFTNEEVVTIAPDGSRRTNLTNHPSHDNSPVYSPDGRRIAFTSHRSEPPGFEGNSRLYSELYVMDADGSHVRRVTFSFGFIDFQPAWSPDGRRLVFMRGLASEPTPEQFIAPTDLWIVDLRTGIERDVTNSPETWEGWPQWSPDGQRIVFDGDLSAPGNNDVYTIRPNGRDVQRLTKAPSVEADANFSPDGKLISFDSDSTGNFDVYLMRATGAQIVQLTSDPAFDGTPAFSPDGDFIAFTSERKGGVADIFRMRADGSQQVNLTRSPTTVEFDPDWQAL